MTRSVSTFRQRVSDVSRSSEARQTLTGVDVLTSLILEQRWSMDDFGHVLWRNVNEIDRNNVMYLLILYRKYSQCERLFLNCLLDSISRKLILRGRLHRLSWCRVSNITKKSRLQLGITHINSNYLNKHLNRQRLKCYEISHKINLKVNSSII